MRLRASSTAERKTPTSSGSGRARLSWMPAGERPQMFGFPLLGGSNSVAGVYAGDGWLAIDWLFWIVFYGYTESGQLLVFNAINSALGIGFGDMSGVMVVQDYKFGGWNDGRRGGRLPAARHDLPHRERSGRQGNLDLEFVWGHLMTYIDVFWRLTKTLRWSPVDDPLVIDLDGDGIETVAIGRSKTYFDVDGDLFAERTGWLKGDDGFLVLDSQRQRPHRRYLGDVRRPRRRAAIAELAALRQQRRRQDQRRRPDLVRAARLAGQGPGRRDRRRRTEDARPARHRRALAGPTSRLDVDHAAGRRACSRARRGHLRRRPTGQHVRGDLRPRTTIDTRYARRERPSPPGRSGPAASTPRASARSPTSPSRWRTIVELGELASRRRGGDDRAEAQDAGRAGGRRARPVGHDARADPRADAGAARRGRARARRCCSTAASMSRMSQGGYWTLESGAPVLDAQGQPRRAARRWSRCSAQARGWRLEQAWSPATRGEPLEDRDEAPYLMRMENGRAVILDYGIRQAGRQLAARLRHRDRRRRRAMPIAAPTRDIVLAQAHADRHRMAHRGDRLQPLRRSAGRGDRRALHRRQGGRLHRPGHRPRRHLLRLGAQSRPRARAGMEDRRTSASSTCATTRSISTNLDEVGSTDDSAYRVELLTPAQFHFATQPRRHRFPPADADRDRSTESTGHIAYSVNESGPREPLDRTDYRLGDQGDDRDAPAGDGAICASVSRRFAVRLALQGGLARIRPRHRLRRRERQVLGRPPTASSRRCSRRSSRRAPDADEAAFDYLTDWNEILWQIYPDYAPGNDRQCRRAARSRIDQAYIIQMLLPAFENVGIDLDIRGRAPMRCRSTRRGSSPMPPRTTRSCTAPTAPTTST